MKSYMIAAGALLLGTSAPALAADPEIKGAKAAEDEAAYSVDPVSGSHDMSGMGGPLDEGGATTLADLTPRPATQNYPPCEPGPGDDGCIQLYEPGVRAQLAGWNRPTGGLADGSQATAMGGPYEPTDKEMAAHTVDEPDVRTVATDEALAAHADHQGVGGPIVSQSGYPPCEPGPGDDRCIQLYERGVTGAGN